MLKEIVAAGGSGYLIPAVLFVLVLYTVRGVFGLHSRRSQHRKEFLELWDSARSQDDLWLELAVRHLFGTYLPARVIRLALAQPDKCQALLELSELWPLLRFDSDTQTVSWLHSRHRTQRRRKAGRAMLLGGYFAFAMIAVFSALVAYRSGPDSFFAWLYGFCAVASGFMALVFVIREDAIKTAATVGDAWLNRINRSAPQEATLRTVAVEHDAMGDADFSLR